MSIIDFLRLIRRHLILLVIVPILLSALVVFLTRKPNFRYSSETTLYTGIASGSSIEMDKSFSFFANNTAFDNLINTITSRKTQQAVSIRLLAQHLLIPGVDVRFISAEPLAKLRQITPSYVMKLVETAKIKAGNPVESNPEIDPKSPSSDNSSDPEFKYHTVKPNEKLNSVATEYKVSLSQLRLLNSLENDSIKPGQILRVGKRYNNGNNDEFENSEQSTDTFSFAKLNDNEQVNTIPASINPKAFNLLVQYLENLLISSDTSFVYKVLNYDDPHYSIKALSSISVFRIASSDLVKIKFETDDPGICQQTLAILISECIKSFKAMKENRSDAVVKYFQHQLKLAAERLKIGEEKLLKFNEDNNIINYYEQSKAIAIVKEDLDVDFSNKQIKLAGIKASIKRIEEKLSIQEVIQLRSEKIVENRNKLSNVCSQIAIIELASDSAAINTDILSNLKSNADSLKEEIRKNVSDFYNYTHSVEGIPITKLLESWINSIIEYEDNKAGLEVLGNRIKEFQKQYEIYAPAGANIKRIEREISVSEQEFLEILHGLNLANLKMQDAELSSSIQAVDLPYFPLSPIPTKRKFLIIAAALVGFIIVLGVILASEYFDKTLKDMNKAHKFTNINVSGVFPRILLKSGLVNFPGVTNRLIDMLIQNLNFQEKDNSLNNLPGTILFFSTSLKDGKTITAGKLAWKLKSEGKKVLFMNYSHESLDNRELSQMGNSSSILNNQKVSVQMNSAGYRFIRRLFGYEDHRIDYNSIFLQPAENYLTNTELIYYNINDEYFRAEKPEDLIDENQFVTGKPDFIIIEIPPLLRCPFPAALVSSCMFPILVCRANRIWTSADKNALELIQIHCKNKIHLLLNGVELNVAEQLLGDLPKKRGWLRRFLKNIFRLQFNNKQLII